jgi:hypothetical protein
MKNSFYGFLHVGEVSIFRKYSPCPRGGISRCHFFRGVEGMNGRNAQNKGKRGKIKVN